MATYAEGEVDGVAYAVTSRPDDERIWVTFEKRVSREACKALRRNGYKWSPQRGSWVRSLTPNAVVRVDLLTSDLERANA